MCAFHASSETSLVTREYIYDSIYTRYQSTFHAKLLQSCLTLGNPMDWNLPDSSIHGILQSRTLQWVDMCSSKGIFPTQGSNPHLLCLLHWQVSSLPLAQSWKPYKEPRIVKFRDRKENGGSPRMVEGVVWSYCQFHLMKSLWMDGGNSSKCECT